jgi:hypothetical protein
MTGCAAFIQESHMKLDKPTNLDRNPAWMGFKAGGGECYPLFPALG